MPDHPIPALRTCWLPRPADTLATARAWLHEVAGEATAEGLQRDLRGRPRLLPGHGDIGWSHSGDTLLMAWVPTGRIGVDIEARTRSVPAMRIARRYFAEQEIAALAARESALRHDAFLRLWCAKEAVLKAHGGGIAFGLHKAVFDIGGNGLQMLRCDPSLGRVDDWRLDLLETEPDFIAVLASTA